MKKSEFEALTKKQASQAKELEQAQKLLEEREQNPTLSVIQEEEKILEMMEDQEIPAGSGNRYRYILARKDDRAARTGRPKYLPVDTCMAYGMNCEPRMKNIEARRQKRGGFTTGLMKAGEKLLDGSPGGFLVEMVRH